jgi:transposase InsO family protein
VIEDEFTREGLTLEVRRSFKAKDVLDVVSELMLIRGAPAYIRSDNGPELIAQAIRSFLEHAKVATLYIEPGAPWQNAYVESFDSRFRAEVLNQESFAELGEAKQVSAWWQNHYNHRRPHSSLGYRPPAAYAAMIQTNGRNSVPGRSSDQLLTGPEGLTAGQSAKSWDESTLTSPGK